MAFNGFIRSQPLNNIIPSSSTVQLLVFGNIQYDLLLTHSKHKAFLPVASSNLIWVGRSVGRSVGQYNFSLEIHSAGTQQPYHIHYVEIYLVHFYSSNSRLFVRPS